MQSNSDLRGLHQKRGMAMERSVSMSFRLLSEWPTVRRRVHKCIREIQTLLVMVKASLQHTESLKLQRANQESASPA
jgi:hypothetical protein